MSRLWLADDLMRTIHHCALPLCSFYVYNFLCTIHLFLRTQLFLSTHSMAPTLTLHLCSRLLIIVKPKSNHYPQIRVLNQIFLSNISSLSLQFKNIYVCTCYAIVNMASIETTNLCDALKDCNMERIRFLWCSKRFDFWLCPIYINISIH